MKTLNAVVNAVAAAALLLASAARAQETLPYQETVDNSPSGMAMAVDLLVVRPISLVATVLGCGLFVLQLPLSAIQMEPPRAAAQKLVVEPVRYTFTRPLGEIE